MCEAFIKLYKKDDLPSNKQELFNIFNEFAKRLKPCYIENNIKAFINLKEMIAEIKPIDNSFSEKINKSFISYLDEYIKEVQGKIR